MKTSIVKLSLRLAVFTLLVAFFSGCAWFGPTKPKSPYEGAYPPKFSHIVQKNPLLAKELGKLPEIQDGISAIEASALERIVGLYNSDPASFDSSFEQMYRVGLPEVRKYCSPLQALFWMAKDGKLDNRNNPLADYSLEKLLDGAWECSYLSMSDKQLSIVIDGIKDEEIKMQYLIAMDSVPRSIIQGCILSDYKSKRNIFSRNGQEIIKQAFDNPRWKNFSVVVDRLNAPELVDYYERKRLSWVDWRTQPTPTVPPYYVFKYNEGDCVSITGFTIHCLWRGGYKAKEVRLTSRAARGGYDFHAVCLFEVHGEKYIMDNGRPVPVGIMPLWKHRERFDY